MPRLFQAKWQKLEGGHDTGSGIHVASHQGLSHATPQQIPRLLDSPRLASSARAFTQTPHDVLAQLIPAPPPLIAHNPHTRASVPRPDKQSLFAINVDSLALAVERQHTPDTPTVLDYPHPAPTPVSAPPCPRVILPVLYTTTAAPLHRGT